MTWTLVTFFFFSLLFKTLAEPVFQESGKKIVVRCLRQKILLDPAVELWRNIPPVQISLGAQDVRPPYGGGSIQAVTVKAVHNGKMLAFLLEWDDPTMDITIDALDSFRDSAALMFPLDPRNPAQPLMGQRYMGEKSAIVNIWQFKADCNANGHCPPVEDLNAAGPGTLTTQDRQDVSGRGIYANGRWKAVFLRALKTDDKDDAQFWPGLHTWVNFAAWDGSHKDVDGKKSVSVIWHRLVFQ